jgi:hypothetical protein
MKIDLGLVQDTMNYLVTCPWKDVNGLVAKWNETVNQPDTKPEEPDTNDD